MTSGIGDDSDKDIGRRPSKHVRCVKNTTRVRRTRKLVNNTDTVNFTALVWRHPAVPGAACLEALLLWLRTKRKKAADPTSPLTVLSEQSPADPHCSMFTQQTRFLLRFLLWLFKTQPLPGVSKPAPHRLLPSLFCSQPCLGNC